MALLRFAEDAETESLKLKQAQHELKTMKKNTNKTLNKNTLAKKARSSKMLAKRVKIANGHLKGKCNKKLQKVNC